MKRAVMLGVTATLAISGILIAPTQDKEKPQSAITGTVFYPDVVAKRPIVPKVRIESFETSRAKSRQQINVMRSISPPEKSVKKHVRFVPKKKVVPKPKPVEKVIHYAGKLWPGASSAWLVVSHAVQQDAICVVHHESYSAGLYTAENPTSTASGIMQAIDSTGRSWMKAVGIKWKGHMSYHSHYEQDLAFIYGLTHSRGAWKSCR